MNALFPVKNRKAVKKRDFERKNDFLHFPRDDDDSSAFMGECLGPDYPGWSRPCGGALSSVGKQDDSGP